MKSFKQHLNEASSPGKQALQQFAKKNAPTSMRVNAKWNGNIFTAEFTAIMDDPSNNKAIKKLAGFLKDEMPGADDISVDKEGRNKWVLTVVSDEVPTKLATMKV